MIRPIVSARLCSPKSSSASTPTRQRREDHHLVQRILGGPAPFFGGGAYVNFMMEEGQERVQATYRDNYQRLAEIKKKYDPNNFFRVNQNIRPAE